MSEKIITTKEAAGRKAVTAHTIRRWIGTGRLRALKFGRVWMIREADLENVELARPGRRPRERGGAG